MFSGWVGGCDGVAGWGGIPLVSPTCRTRPPHARPIFFKRSSPIFQLRKLPREIGTEQLEMSWLFSWKLTNLCGRVKVEAKLLHFKHSARVSHCTVSLCLWNLTSILCHNKWESEAMQCCKKMAQTPLVLTEKNQNWFTLMGKWRDIASTQYELFLTEEIDMTNQMLLRRRSISENPPSMRYQGVLSFLLQKIYFYTVNN